MKGRGSRESETGHVDAGLDRVQRAREVIVAEPPSVERDLRLADLAEVEAAWWECLSEQARVRVYWRAAFAAREHALAAAGQWRRRAGRQLSAELPQQATAIEAVA